MEGGLAPIFFSADLTVHCCPCLSGGKGKSNRDGGAQDRQDDAGVADDEQLLGQVGPLQILGNDGSQEQRGVHSKQGVVDGGGGGVSLQVPWSSPHS